MQNKKIGITVAVICGILFLVLIFTQEKVNNTNLVYLYPTTLIVGLFFAFLSSTGKVKNAFKQVGTILAVFAVITLIWFLFRN